MLGLETRPSVMGTLTGKASYTGQFNGGGGLFDESGDFVRDGREAQGNITLDINFTDQMVSADLEGELDGATDFVGSVASMEIDGNGYSGALLTECESGITCTSNSMLSGNFFGPAAEEAAGHIDFDVTISVDADGEERRYLGVSAFAAGDAFEHADLSPGGGSGPPPLLPAPPGS
ncbi:hypothetical protein SAMN05444003_1193 [Cognatiyoonia sediminum]|uniref:Transferrin-binding protein B C-lobe/N-lobe beta-barrel domain-containing protein n=1 Tax=Cognatiyoonia sediminum TaxID=1508389 RepID=A0A1M5N525_9RHOB|nr:transferrin-binding protein-like solute binding protein [Cognatiyoonia sediminum]SHG84670.1 hypothetical protein SAMN05444003_1193 [Cognatiyoonia sediminum]